MATLSKQSKYALIARLQELHDKVQDDKGEIIDNLIEYASTLVDTDECYGKPEIADSEFKREKVKTFKKPEMAALRWVGMGGSPVVMTTAKKDSKNSNLQPVDLGSRWKTPKHEERITAGAFYAAVLRETKAEVLAHYAEKGKKKEAAQIALPLFEEETALGWITDYEYRQSPAYLAQRELKTALMMAIEAGDAETMKRVEADLKRQLKEIHDARKAKEEERRAKTMTDAERKAETDEKAKSVGMEDYA